MTLDLSDDEEIGEFIYRTSHTAKLLREKKEKEDEEGMSKATDRSIENHLLAINTKEAVKAEVKTEDDADISTDDEQYTPEYVVSSSAGYDPIKSEETDDEELGDKDTNTSKEQQQHLPIKDEMKNTDDSTNDERGNEINEPETRRKSLRLLSNPSRTTRTNAHESIDIQHTTKKRNHCSKRKRIVEESNRSVQTTARIECSVEGCTGTAADSGTCMHKHKGYNHCKEEGCTNRIVNRGVCIKHGAVKKVRKTCKHEGCTNYSLKGGVCMKHGAKVKTCTHEGCTNRVVKGGVCYRHGATVTTRKTCIHEGCTNQSKTRGLCNRHYKILNGRLVNKTCSHNGCTNKVVSRGVCINGAKRKGKNTCSHDDVRFLLT